jgi:hypothetical protein
MPVFTQQKSRDQYAEGRWYGWLERSRRIYGTLFASWILIQSLLLSTYSHNNFIRRIPCESTKERASKSIDAFIPPPLAKATKYFVPRYSVSSTASSESWPSGNSKSSIGVSATIQIPAQAPSSCRCGTASHSANLSISCSSGPILNLAL